MTESTRLTKILLDILDHVKHRGNSTKVNWMNFSDGQPVSRSKFDSLVTKFGLPIRDGDLDIIWANIDVKGSSMGYSDFVRFITLDKIDASKGGGLSSRRPVGPPQPTYAEGPPPEYPRDAGRQMAPPDYSRDMAPPDYSAGRDAGRQMPPSPRQNQPQAASLSSILLNNKAQIGNAMLMTDPRFTGFITVADFEDIIQRIALVNSSEIQRLVAIYDTTNSGYFNYFMLLGDICNQTNEVPSMRGGGRGMDDYYGAPQGGADDYYGSQQPGGNYRASPPPPQTGPGGMDDYYGAPQGGDDYYSQPPAGGNYRGAQQAPGDDYYSPQSKGDSGGRHNYDYYDAPSAPPPSKSRHDEIIELVASRMDNVYDSSQTCYHKWRGYSKLLGPQEFMSGARRDFKIDMTLDEAAEVLSHYSNKEGLSLGEFLKLVGAGSDIVSANRKKQASTALSEEEKTLLHIARQAKAKGADWREVFEKTDSVDRVVQSLRTINIYVMLNDLRPCYTKFKGKEGVIQKIQELMSQA